MVKESAVFIVRHQNRRPGQLVLKKPELTDEFQQSIFKGKLKKGLQKSLQMVTEAMKLKDAYSLEGNLWPT